MLRRRVEFAFERGTLCERETEVDVTFHFSCFACCFKQTLPKTGVFTVLQLSRVLLRDAVRCSACAMRNNLKGHCAYHECDGGLTLRFTF